jgi:hypothetical protein
VYWDKASAEGAASYARQEIYGWAGAGGASGGGTETHGGSWGMGGVGFCCFNGLVDKKCNGNQSAMVFRGRTGSTHGL